MKMEALDPTTAAACFMVDDEDDLLNFSLEDEQTLQQEQEQSSKDLSSSSFSSNPLVTSLLPTHPSECVEEELEWLSNKDAFPAVEFGILSDNPGIVFDHHSPVSVLENSSSTSNSSGNGNANGSAYMSCCASLKVPVNYPVRARSKRRRRRRRSGLTDVPVEHCLSLHQGSFKNTKRQQPLLSLPLPMSSAKSSIGRRCQHCGVDKTPQWRAGPLGPKTLCNACGVRYKSGRLLPEYRPANSPTFSAALHSNSHRKVIEMRKQKIGVGGMMTHEACGYRSPWLIVDAEESFDVPIMQGPSVSQASLKNNKQQQPLLSLQMSSAKSASIGWRCQDCGVDETPKWRASPLGPKTLCNACGARYKSVHKTSFKNNSQQQLLLSLLMNSAKSASIKRTCQHCGVDNTPECQAGPLKPKALCDACRVRYKSVTQVSFKNRSQQPLLSLPMNSANSGCTGRKCQHCGADKTPQWRVGPLEQTLCNACGVRYRSGRLLPEYRPVNSPTFSAALHSNSHRKVLKMRKQNGVGGGNDDS